MSEMCSVETLRGAQSYDAKRDDDERTTNGLFSDDDNCKEHAEVSTPDMDHEMQGRQGSLEIQYPNQPDGIT